MYISRLLAYLHTRYKPWWGLESSGWASLEEFNEEAKAKSRAVDLSFEATFHVFMIRVVNLDDLSTGHVSFEDTLMVGMPVMDPVYGPTFTEKQAWLADTKGVAEIVFLSGKNERVRVTDALFEEMGIDIGHWRRSVGGKTKE